MNLVLVVRVRNTKNVVAIKHLKGKEGPEIDDFLKRREKKIKEIRTSAIKRGVAAVTYFSIEFGKIEVNINEFEDGHLVIDEKFNYLREKTTEEERKDTRSLYTVKWRHLVVNKYIKLTNT